MEATHQHPVQLHGGLAGEIVEGQAWPLRNLHLGTGVLQQAGECLVGVTTGLAVEVTR